MGRGLIWVMIWKLPYHNLFIIHFSFWQDRMRSQRQDRRVLRMWWYGFFTRAKKAVSPTLPGDMGFLPGQKSRITHVTHYHTFCAPQQWYVLESHVSITYAKWAYFLVNIWQCTLLLFLLVPDTWDMPYLYKQYRSRSVQKPTDLDLHCLSFSMWLYQQPGSTNLIGWISEMGAASQFIQHDKDWESNYTSFTIR